MASKAFVLLAVCSIFLTNLSLYSAEEEELVADGSAEGDDEDGYHQEEPEIITEEGDDGSDESISEAELERRGFGKTVKNTETKQKRSLKNEGKKL